MNWGKGLVIGLASFMIFITVLVVLMFRTAEDNFDKDYYERGLAYDIDYNQMQQVIADKVQPIVKQTQNYVTINFAVADSGSVNFKRPSDSKKDQLFSFNQKDLQFTKDDFEKGEWRIEIRWTAGDKKYLYQTNLFLR
ncbi:FixH family protein [Pedobacter arcticus]|uniref:FixH family protein n=1 Tax=Pedobacter arcticus TaxID=752140 RepID=UPI0002D7A459|nr:FixH family protein [Pedobacter arcticus]